MIGGDGPRRPNFFLVGAAKSGTTSVANYLDQHPEVFVCRPKEPNYFAFEPNSKPVCQGPVDSELLYEQLLKYTVTSPDEYHRLFADARQAKAVGEASVRYLYESQVPERLAAYAPQARLIVILRDPVDRLYSHYHMNVSKHVEPETLQAALADESERVQRGYGWDWHYRRVGKYGEQLQRYFQCFDREQVLVLFHSQLQTEPLGTMAKIFQHLGVDSDFRPDVSSKALVGRTPKWRTLRHLIRDDNPMKTVAKLVVPKPLRKSFVRWTESKNLRSIPPLDPLLRQELRHDFAADAQLLSDLLERPLPW